LQLEAAAPCLAADEYEAQKLEGFRFALVALLSALSRITTKLQQARFLPM